MSTRVLGGAAALFAHSSLLVLLALPVHLMTSQDIPGDVVEALYPATLSLEDGSPLLNISFSSRGVQKLTTFEEPDLDWIYPGGYSAWDYTEWHWWKGHPFDFQASGHGNPAYWQSFRPRFWGNPKVRAERLQQGYVRIDFETDGFQFSQDYLLPGRAEPDSGYWDMLFTATNSTGRQIEEYGHFFACYTSVNGERSYWFWDAGGELVLWKDREAGHLNGYVSSSEAGVFPARREDSPLSSRKRPDHWNLAPSRSGLPRLSGRLALGHPTGSRYDRCHRLWDAGGGRHGLHLLPRSQGTSHFSAGQQLPFPPAPPHGQEPWASLPGAAGGMVERVPGIEVRSEESELGVFETAHPRGEGVLTCDQRLPRKDLS